MIQENPTLPVHLTLEETGVLCHLLMQKMLVEPDRGPFGTDMRPFKQRMAVLYSKLSIANDNLMGQR